jgi:hypothetical protein
MTVTPLAAPTASLTSVPLSSPMRRSLLQWDTPAYSPGTVVRPLPTPVEAHPNTVYRDHGEFEQTFTAFNNKPPGTSGEVGGSLNPTLGPPHLLHAYSTRSAAASLHPYPRSGCA